MSSVPSNRFCPATRLFPNPMQQAAPAAAPATVLGMPAVTGAIIGQESTASQMILYGKRMLFNSELFDFENRIAKIDAVTEEDVPRAIRACFGQGCRAAALVGNVEKPLSI